MKNDQDKKEERSRGEKNSGLHNTLLHTVAVQELLNCFNRRK